MNQVFVQEVIISKLEKRGLGKEGDPVRRITQVYSTEGELIAEKDPYDGDKFVLFDLVHFARYILDNKFATVDAGDVAGWLGSIHANQTPTP